MRRISILLVAALCLFAVSAKAQVALPPGFWASAGSSSVSNEDSLARFPHGQMYKAASRATGNGSTNNTSAIQSCLNGISSSAYLVSSQNLQDHLNANPISAAGDVYRPDGR